MHRLQIGSEAHKELFCQDFMASHRAYEPENLPWPNLDQEALARLRTIPFWDEALRTERYAGVLIQAYAATVTDPILQAAIALQAKEEARHARLINTLIQRYQIPLQEPVAPEVNGITDLEAAFIRFGYGECFDSFFAFGLFGLARQVDLFPRSLVNLFEPIVAEEARHLVFFVNWIAYQQVRWGQKDALRQGLFSLWHYSGALRRRWQTLSQGSQGRGSGFTAISGGQVVQGLTPAGLLATCLQENDQRMSQCDPQLLRPEVMPAIASFCLRGLKLLS